jgi:hypothetical protein
MGKHPEGRNGTDKHMIRTEVWLNMMVLVSHSSLSVSLDSGTGVNGLKV